MNCTGFRPKALRNGLTALTSYQSWGFGKFNLGFDNLDKWSIYKLPKSNEIARYI